MATVHYARLEGALGVARTVAIKRLHPHLAKDAELVAMFVDEVRLASRVQHPNVVHMVDVVLVRGEAFLVMEHIPGESLVRLMRAAHRDGETIPPPVAVAIVCGVLAGLHAAHEARGAGGEPLHIVHRDVSPQNILLGVEGVPRLIDFGVAKAAGRLQTTAEGCMKGKIGYMSPEQVRGEDLDRRADVYAAGVVLWELLTGRRMVSGPNPVASMRQVLEGRIEAPAASVPGLPDELNAAVMRALSYEREGRFATARQMASALEASTPIASAIELGEWVKRLAGDVLAERARVVADIESGRALPAQLGTDVSEEPTKSGVTREHLSGTERRRIWVVAAAAVSATLLGAVALTRVRRSPSPPSVAPPPSAIVVATPLAPASNLAPPSAPEPGSTPAAAPITRKRRPPPPAPRSAPVTADAGCRVEQFTGADGLVHFRCAP
jgi:serine/threonine-protein kinase